MDLKNKTILILSQQDWGEMFISKHHYAVELAKLGNTVYFINGPDQRNILKPGEIKITQTAYKNLYLLEHRLFFPYFIKFKAPFLYKILVKRHLKKIIRKIGSKVNIVWSFDISNTLPLSGFSKRIKKVFMPVDEPLHEVAIESANGADAIFSVTNEILEKYKAYDVPRYFINHGVSQIFINERCKAEKNTPVHVGISGNMLRPDIDYDTLLSIIKHNKNIVFDIWGTVDPQNSNLATRKNTNKKALDFVKALSTLDNVIMHGQLKPEILAQQLKKTDAFLICYDLKKDQSKGTNYHKILEYLAAGKVVIANNVTTYKFFPGLIEMIESRENNNELPNLFHKIINDLDKYNSLELQNKRIEFAKTFTYDKQILKIESLLNNYCKN